MRVDVEFPFVLMMACCVRRPLRAKNIASQRKLLSDSKISGNWMIFLEIKRFLNDMLTLRRRMRKCISQIKQNFSNIRTIVDAQIPNIRIPIPIFDKRARKTNFPVSRDVLRLFESLDPEES
ncbi:hypothetical protein TNCV_4028331 [Trichonephila clavipes]|nr:hypothetical protein TNCV_4028331 [Trichonephila clavipes]